MSIDYFNEDQDTTDAMIVHSAPWRNIMVREIMS